MKKSLMLIVCLLLLIGAALGQTVTISSPVDNSTVSSAHVVASASSPRGVKLMQVYLDGKKVYEQSGASLDTALSTSSGSHRLTVQAYDGMWVPFKSTVYFTLSSSTPIPSPTPAPSPSTAYHYYVSQYGSDANPGTSSTYPFRTIKKAVSVAPANSTIHVMDGTYVENVVISRSGTSSGHIILKSENKWKARVKGPSSQNFAFKINEGVSYIEILDFEITGDSSTAYGGTGILDYGNHTKISGNWVHHLVTTDTVGYGYGVGIHVPWNGQTSPKHTYNEISNNFVDNVRSVDSSKNVGECIYVGDQYNSIINNLTTNCYRHGIQVNHFASHNYIVGNTVDRCPHNAGIMVAVGGDSAYTLVSDGNVVANNIVTNSTKGITAWQSSGSTFSTNNKWINNTTFNNGTNVSLGDVPSGRIQISGGSTSDPLFVGSGNYRLRSGSPAVNTGTNSYVIGTALDGSARLQSGTVDRGAYEQ